MRGLIRFVLAGAAVMWAGMATAGPLPNGGVTSQEVVGVMRGMKLPTEVTVDKDGDPLIWTNSGGQKYGVYFYQCKNKRCTSIQFSAGFDGASKIPASKVAEWNRTKRFGRAYAQGDTLYVEMDMDVERGATTEALANNFERWVAVLEQFPKYFQ